MIKGAVISNGGLYRYGLSRIWNEEGKKVMFMMLNPSTADAEKDDPTTRRCINYAKSWGYGGLYVGNLFAYRSTKPEGLFKVFDPVGPENDYWISVMAQRSYIVVCAWGNKRIIEKMRPEHRPLDFVDNSLYYLELSKDGIPKHPLYLKKDLKPKLWIP